MRRIFDCGFHFDFILNSVVRTQRQGLPNSRCSLFYCLDFLVRIANSKILKTREHFETGLGWSETCFILLLYDLVIRSRIIMLRVLGRINYFSH